MFDNKSDYAQNKRDKDSIVYISATGPIRLTRADFPSEDAFLKWKRWSDGDYHTAEKAGRGERDNCLPLVVEYLDFIVSVPSVEDELFQALEEAEAQANRSRLRVEMMVQIRGRLTEKQFRRVWMLHVKGMTVTEIANAENVSKATISKSISSAEKIIRSFFLNERLTG